MAGRFKYTANQLLKKSISKLPKGLEIDGEALDNLSEQLSIHIENAVQDWERAGRAAMKDLRCTAMSTWISNRKNGRYIAYTKSIKFYKSFVKQEGNGEITVTIRSYVDSDVFSEIFKSESTAYNKLEQWREKHSQSGWSYGNVTDGDPIDMPYSIGEYVLLRMWHWGYTSLPPHEFDTGTGWVNNHFVPSETLYDYTSKQFEKKWGKTVKKLYGNV